MKLLNKKIKINRNRIYHYISIAITLGFLALAIFVFSSGVIRLGESLRDLWFSICYYFCELLDLNFVVRPTVIDYSSVSMTPIFGLPGTWEEFRVFMSDYWDLFFSLDNLSGFFNSFGETIGNISRFILLFGVPLLLLVYVLYKRYLEKTNNDYNIDKNGLIFCKKMYRKIVFPVIKFIKRYIEFLKKNPRYYKLWILIWIYNFNVLVIVIEFVAFYLYFVASFDVINIYVQVIKLVCDLSVAVAFVPSVIWFIISLWLIDLIRRKKGYENLKEHEQLDRDFINDLPIVSMACGTMGSKKTTMITDMSLLQEVMFREKALELMLENDLRFPQFPWCNLENVLRRAIKNHEVYTLATVRAYIKMFKHFFELGQEKEEYKSCIRRYLKRKYKYPYKNMMFDYDFEKYGMQHDDKLKVINIWDCLESYAQEYFVYTCKHSLIVSNYAIRTDSVVDDLGNLPLRDNDFYHRDSNKLKENSRFSNILDFNALRLGKKLGGEDDPKKDSFEFGVVTFTEGGKERKNSLQLQELKKKDDSANQKNDGFNDWLKMVRHSGTIDYYPFVRIFTDEQRPESWGADGRDLCQIIHIQDGGETKLAMPFFFIEQLIYDMLYPKLVDVYTECRHVRGDNTVPLYCLKFVLSRMQKFYKNVYNTFGFAKMTLAVEDGTLEGEKKQKFYYLDYKRIYSDRFSTDCFSEFFTNKALRSEIGINDLDEYKSSKATFEELQLQNSYFVNDLINKD